MVLPGRRLDYFPESYVRVIAGEIKPAIFKYFVCKRVSLFQICDGGVLEALVVVKLVHSALVDGDFLFRYVV